MDADCPSKLACFSGVCKNPCYETKPCAAHAICNVVDTLPLRTMVCQCEPGYVGDAEIECKLGKLHVLFLAINNRFTNDFFLKDSLQVFIFQNIFFLFFVNNVLYTSNIGKIFVHNFLYISKSLENHPQTLFIIIFFFTMQ